MAGSIFTATRSVPGMQTNRQVAYAWPETCKEACKGSRQVAYPWPETCKEACNGKVITGNNSPSDEEAGRFHDRTGLVGYVGYFMIGLV